MSYFLVFLAVVVAAAVAIYVVSFSRHQSDKSAPLAIYDDGALTAPVSSLAPVLLPQNPVAADVDRLRFALGLRGYRMDQVDEVLDKLRDQLSAKDAKIAELETLLRKESTAAVEPLMVTPAVAVASE